MPLPERRRYLKIARLSRLPLWPEIVHRLCRGQSTFEVASWVMSQPAQLRGDVDTYDTARNYLSALATEIRNIQTHEVPDTSLKELGDEGRELSNKFDEQLRRATENNRLYLTQSVMNMRTMDKLNYVWSIQNERVMDLQEMEKKLKMPLPHGNKTVELLAKIAAMMGRIEMGQDYLDRRMKLGMTFDDSAPPDVQLEETRIVSQMDPTDKNIIRDVTAKIIDLIEHEGSFGQYKRRLEPDAERTEGPETPSKP